MKKIFIFVGIYNIVSGFIAALIMCLVTNFEMYNIAVYTFISCVFAGILSFITPSLFEETKK